jgi:hypothetical protein
MIGQNIRHKVQIVISGAFNNKSVHIVGVIIVRVIKLTPRSLHPQTNSAHFQFDTGLVRLHSRSVLFAEDGKCLASAGNGILIPRSSTPQPRLHAD